MCLLLVAGACFSSVLFMGFQELNGITPHSYDNLISRHVPLKSQVEPICAMCLQIAVEKITVALASFQSSSVKALVKEERSFGYWSPRRCDVYVVSYHPGYLVDRLEVVSYLWQHGISADFMYESGLPDSDFESHVDMCVREGILYVFLLGYGLRIERSLVWF